MMLSGGGAVQRGCGSQ